VDLYNKLLLLVGNDLLQIFGPSGSGKSTFAYLVMKSALEQGKKVFWLDSERNLSDKMIDELKAKYSNLTYIYTPVFSEVMNHARNLPTADLYVLDSLGFSVLPQYAEASMDEKGRMLLKAVSLTQYFKIATYRNKALAIVTNQPVSSFGKPGVPEDMLKPFGDKSIYGYKTVWRTSIDKTNESETVCLVKAWRDRNFGRDKLLFRLRITSAGVEYESFV
jgi:RecA/RadA recombinase